MPAPRNVWDRIVDYKIRQPDPKRCAVQAFHSLKYRVLAAGDSYNDIAMLEEADHGFFFAAPDNVLDEYPQYPHAPGSGSSSRITMI